MYEPDYDEMVNDYWHWRDRLGDELYEEHRDEAISDFTDERMQSYYLNNRTIDSPSRDAFEEARQLLGEHHFTAAFLLAHIATEVTFRDAILKPVVCGLVHSESASQLIADLVASRAGFDRFRDLLFLILNEHAGIDLQAYKREGARVTLWAEFRQLQKQRNLVVHRAHVVAEEAADHAVLVAAATLETVFPRVVRGVGLHFREDGSIWRGRHMEALYLGIGKDGES